MEAAGGDVAAGVASFYGDSVPHPEDPRVGNTRDVLQQSVPGGPRRVDGEQGDSAATPWPSAASSSGARAPKGSSRGASGGVMTMNDLRGGAGDEEPRDESSDDPVNFFTGGERSALSVENPDRARPLRSRPRDWPHAHTCMFNSPRGPALRGPGAR